MSHPAPRHVGCVRCGDEVPADQAAFRQCPVCGKVVGLCRASCARALGWHFLPDAMAWHLDRVHRGLTGAATICARLLAPEHPWRIELDALIEPRRRVARAVLPPEVSHGR